MGAHTAMMDCEKCRIELICFSFLVKITPVITRPPRHTHHTVYANTARMVMRSKVKIEKQKIKIEMGK